MRRSIILSLALLFVSSAVYADGETRLRSERETPSDTHLDQIEKESEIVGQIHSLKQVSPENFSVKESPLIEPAQLSPEKAEDKQKILQEQVNQDATLKKTENNNVVEEDAILSAKRKPRAATISTVDEYEKRSVQKKRRKNVPESLEPSRERFEDDDAIPGIVAFLFLEENFSQVNVSPSECSDIAVHPREHSEGQLICEPPRPGLPAILTGE